MLITEHISESRYRSRLYTARVSMTRHAELFLSPRVCLQKVQPTSDSETIRDYSTPNNPGNEVPIQRWSETEWVNWRRRFTSLMQNAFDCRAWLVPSVPWLPTSAGPVPTTPVRCRLQVVLIGNERNANVTIRCARIHDGATHRSFMDGPLARPPYEGQLDHRDLQQQNKRCSLTNFVTQQVPAVHEFGHFLGLSHVAAGSDTPYGNNDYQRGDCMGAGSRMEPWHFRPWRLRLEQHVTGVRGLTWTATLNRPRTVRRARLVF